MKDFIQKVLTELNENEKINSNSLVKMVVESANKSISNRENTESIYKQIKNDLSKINEHLNDQTIGILLSQFDKNEETTDAIIERMAKMGDLKSEIASIKESTAVSNPVIAASIERFESMLESTAEFKLYPSFINEFSKYSTEKSVQESVNAISKVLESNAEDLEVLFNIYEMSGIHSALYSGIIGDLKEMLVNESYSADIIDLKFGKTNLPMVKSLVNNLKVLESKRNGEFTLGAGDSNNLIQDVIAPTVSVSEGTIITYIDDRFMKVEESKDKVEGDNVHINEAGFAISTVNPQEVKESHESFYSLCEAFARLGFKQEGNSVVSNSIRNFNLGFAFNESKELEAYVNGTKIDKVEDINLSEALAMESSDVKKMVNTILENSQAILNLKFIKNISNIATLAESTVFELDGNFFLCKKVDSANREWSKVDENEMYIYFKENYNYDISNIYGAAINEAEEKIKDVEARKAIILENVSKLEGAVTEIQEALKSPKLQKGAIPKLEKLKEGIESNISALKEEFIQLDLTKK